MHKAVQQLVLRTANMNITSGYMLAEAGDHRSALNYFKAADEVLNTDVDYEPLRLDLKLLMAKSYVVLGDYIAGQSAADEACLIALKRRRPVKLLRGCWLNLRTVVQSLKYSWTHP